MLGDKGVEQETARECPDCGKWVQLRTTPAGNEWLHVKVDGRSEQVQTECFPEDVASPPKLGEAVVLVSADDDGHRHERAAIVSWTSDVEFLAFVLPGTVYGSAFTTTVRVDEFGKMPPQRTSPSMGWRRVR